MNPALLASNAVDQPVPKPLMISLAMIVHDKFMHGSSEVAFAARNHSVETFFLDGPEESLRIGIRVGGAKRRIHDVDPGVPEETTDVRTPFPVTVAIRTVWWRSSPMSAAVAVRLTWRMNSASG
jgi:hypothetical protein